MFNLLKSLFSGSDHKALKQLMADGALVVDVRTAREFASGHIAGSKNIPVDILNSHIEKLRKSKKPIIVCCASGMRSARAAMLLKQHGIEHVHDAGSWSNLR